MSCKLFFLFMGYSDRLYNVNVWNEFFNTAKPSNYEVLYHAKNFRETEQSDLHFEMTMIPTVWSKYYKLSHPMNALFDAALLRSNSTYDAFITLSADSIPVKSFNQMYQYYCESTVQFAPRPSMFCITPSKQWMYFDKSTKTIVKAHQWIILNRDDALKSVATWKTHPRHQDIYNAWVDNGYKRLNGEPVWEEFWFYSAIQGRFFDTNSSSDGWNGIRFPHDGIQGRCPMYVHWPGYTNDVPFLAEGLPRLNPATDIGKNGNTDLGMLPLEIYAKLKYSQFLFARKFNPDKGNIGGRLSDGTKMSLIEALRMNHYYKPMADGATFSSKKPGEFKEVHSNPLLKDPPLPKDANYPKDWIPQRQTSRRGKRKGGGPVQKGPIFGA